MRDIRFTSIALTLMMFLTSPSWIQRGALAPPVWAGPGPDEPTHPIPPRDHSSAQVPIHPNAANLYLHYTEAETIAALTLGADRLLALQADITEDNAGNGAPDADLEDGGWDRAVDPNVMEHSPTASPKNTYGVTALGILEAYAANAQLRHRTAAIDAYAGMNAAPDVNSCGDARFLVELSKLTDDPTYASLARARYDARISTYGSATGFAAQIVDLHFTQGEANGVIPWDIGLCAMDAAALDEYFPGLGYDADIGAMANVIYADVYEDDPGYFDETDPSEYRWTMGIAGTLLAFEAANLHPTETASLAQTLIDYQNDGVTKSPAGAWDWNDDYSGGDYQTTAYVVMALMAYDSGDARDVAVAGVDWLISEQRPNGSWYWEGRNEYPEEEGEILTAIALAVGQEDPTAVTLASFTAQTRGAGRVALAWETAAEVDNAGFNICRSTSVDGPFVKINATFIGAEGDPVSGAGYTFLDDGLPPGTYYYKLEDVDTDGVVTLHGPVSATVMPHLRRPSYRPTLPES